MTFNEATPIPGHTQFRASPDGTVFGKRKRPMLGHVDKSGYRNVLFSESGKTKQYLVHRLIAITFIPNPNDLPMVNHKDGNKLNNSVENLEWCTRSENTKHSYENGLQTVATNPHGTYRVLNACDKQQILNLHTKGMKDADIAKIIGCTRSLVSRKIREAGVR